MYATHEWVVPTGKHTDVLNSDNFKNVDFLVEYVSGTTGCSCLAKTESMLGVYLGKSVAIMLASPTRWSVKRYALINR